MTKTHKALLETLRSGNFTVQFNDSYCGSIIACRMKDYGERPKGIKEYGFEMGNYGEGIVELLVEALGGVSLST
jgi:hypothetical protein